MDSKNPSRPILCCPSPDLSRVYSFVRQFGGHVKIYSELGMGTSVKIYLPRHYNETEVTEQEKQAA
jgi:hypothetical protein